MANRANEERSPGLYSEDDDLFLPTPSVYHTIRRSPGSIADSMDASAAVTGNPRSYSGEEDRRQHDKELTRRTSFGVVGGSQLPNREGDNGKEKGSEARSTRMPTRDVIPGTPPRYPSQFYSSQHDVYAPVSVKWSRSRPLFGERDTPTPPPMEEDVTGRERWVKRQSSNEYRRSSPDRDAPGTSNRVEQSYRSHVDRPRLNRERAVHSYEEFLTRTPAPARTVESTRYRSKRELQCCPARPFEESRAERNVPTRRSMSRGRRDSKRPAAKLRDYDGSGIFDEYWLHFSSVKDLNGWNEVEARDYLLVSLSGPALQNAHAISVHGKPTLQELQQSLLQRFGVTKAATVHRIKLQHLKRKAGQSVSALGQEIKRLIQLAYPSFDLAALEALAVDKFQEALTDRQQRYFVYAAQPTTLDSAVESALRAEAYESLEGQCEGEQSTRRIRSLQVADVPAAVQGQSVVPPGTSSVDRAIQEGFAALLKEFKKVTEAVKPPPDRGYRGNRAPWPRPQCFHCKGEGHFWRECPNASQTPQMQGHPQAPGQNSWRARQGEERQPTVTNQNSGNYGRDYTNRMAATVDNLASSYQRSSAPVTTATSHSAEQPPVRNLMPPGDPSISLKTLALAVPTKQSEGTNGTSRPQEKDEQDEPRPADDATMTGDLAKDDAYTREALSTWDQSEDEPEDTPMSMLQTPEVMNEDKVPAGPPKVKGLMVEGHLVVSNSCTPFVRCLLDTGAQLSILSTRIFERDCRGEVDLKPSRHTLVTASGAAMKVHGEMQAALEIGSRQISWHWLVADVVEDAILGLDFMTKHRCHWDWGLQTLRLGSENAAKNTHAVLSTDIYLPGRSETFFYCVLQREEGCPTVGLVTGCELFVRRHGLAVASVVAAKSLGQVPVRILNPHFEVISVKKGTVVARYEALEKTVEPLFLPTTTGKEREASLSILTASRPQANSISRLLDTLIDRGISITDLGNRHLHTKIGRKTLGSDKVLATCSDKQMLSTAITVVLFCLCQEQLRRTPKCNDCSRLFKSEEDLKRHRREGSSRWVCPECRRLYLTRKTLLEHWKRAGHPGIMDVPTAERISPLACAWGEDAKRSRHGTPPPTFHTPPPMVTHLGEKKPTSTAARSRPNVKHTPRKRPPSIVSIVPLPMEKKEERKETPMGKMVKLTRDTPAVRIKQEPSRTDSRGRSTGRQESPRDPRNYGTTHAEVTPGGAGNSQTLKRKGSSHTPPSQEDKREKARKVESSTDSSTEDSGTDTTQDEQASVTTEVDAATFVSDMDHLLYPDPATTTASQVLLSISDTVAPTTVVSTALQISTVTTTVDQQPILQLTRVVTTSSAQLTLPLISPSTMDAAPSDLLTPVVTGLGSAPSAQAVNTPALINTTASATSLLTSILTGPGTASSSALLPWLTHPIYIGATNSQIVAPTTTWQPQAVSVATLSVNPFQPGSLRPSSTVTSSAVSAGRRSTRSLGAAVPGTSGQQASVSCIWRANAVVGDRVRRLEESVTRVSERYRRLLAPYEASVEEERSLGEEYRRARDELRTSEVQFREAWRKIEEARQACDDARERQEAKQESTKALRDEIDDVLSELPDPTLMTW